MFKKTAAAISIAALTATTAALPAAAAGQDKPMQVASCKPCSASKGCNPCAAKKGCNPCAADKPYNPYATPAPNPDASKKDSGSSASKSKWN